MNVFRWTILYEPLFLYLTLNFHIFHSIFITILDGMFQIIAENVWKSLNTSFKSKLFNKSKLNNFYLDSWIPPTELSENEYTDQLSRW